MEVAVLAPIPVSRRAIIGLRQGYQVELQQDLEDVFQFFRERWVLISSRTSAWSIVVWWGSLIISIPRLIGTGSRLVLIRALIHQTDLLINRDPLSDRALVLPGLLRSRSIELE